MSYLGGIWKAIKGGDIPDVMVVPTVEALAARLADEPPIVYKASEDPGAKDIDPLDTFNLLPPENQGTQHPGTDGQSLSYNVLDMLTTVPAVQAIIATRINQWAEYAVPQRSRFDVGYRIQLRDPRQKTSEISQRRALELSRWLYTCGDPRLRENALLESWVRSVARDSLVYDQLCSEIVYADNGKPAGFIPVDAKTIRRAQLKPAEWKGLQRGAPGYVQVLRNKVERTWDADHFIFGVRNPRTGIQFNGYGHPELEQAALVISQLVHATTYNATNFTNGVHAAGVLAITATMSEKVFRQHERQLRALMTGSQNAHRAIVAKLDPKLQEKMEWINLTNTNKEMEYSKWIDFLLKIICACFQMDPAELGFVYGNEGQSGALSQAGPNDRIAASKERGLRPNVRFLENMLNTKIIHKLDEDFEVSLSGFDAAQEAIKLEHYNKAVRAFMSIDEVRADQGMVAFDTVASANGPMDGVYQAALQQAKSLEWQQQQAQAAVPAQVGAAADGTSGEEGAAAPAEGTVSPTEDTTPLSEEELAQLFESPEDMKKSLAFRADTLRTLELE